MRGAGVTERVPGSGATTTHTYAAAGTYPITLTVTDDAVPTGTRTVWVTVAGAPNQAPTASFTSAVTGLSVQVNGSGSRDADGTVASYAWDFGDGGTTTPTATHAYATAGTYPVSLTVTDDDGTRDTVTHGVTVAAPLLYARDDFGRSLATGWGAADVGGAWTVSGAADRWSVAGGTGRLSLNPGDGYTAYLGGVSSTNTEVTMVVSTDKAPTGGGHYVSAIGRRVGPSTDYRAKLRLNATGAVSLYLTAMVSNAETVLSSLSLPGVTYAVGDRLNIRLQVTGTAPTTVRAKVWKVGASEPAAWALTSTDSTAVLQSAGSAGLYSFTSGTVTNGPVLYSFDQLWVGPANA